ncbi:hypothetical protein Taro_002108 [Colocasia esculenta]|uniref:Uncharacterized protein n=1 Tax=Colocasia esculenta TaxID=4460 RepID=A0A843TK20_COLES|nr:hypothetical protein [Colocasia esculenta]
MGVYPPIYRISGGHTGGGTLPGGGLRRHGRRGRARVSRPMANRRRCPRERANWRRGPPVRALTGSPLGWWRGGRRSGGPDRRPSWLAEGGADRRPLLPWPFPRGFLGVCWFVMALAAHTHTHARMYLTCIRRAFLPVSRVFDPIFGGRVHFTFLDPSESYAIFSASPDINFRLSGVCISVVDGTFERHTPG